MNKMILCRHTDLSQWLKWSVSFTAVAVGSHFSFLPVILKFLFFFLPLQAHAWHRNPHAGVVTGIWGAFGKGMASKCQAVSSGHSIKNDPTWNLDFSSSLLSSDLFFTYHFLLTRQWEQPKVWMPGCCPGSPCSQLKISACSQAFAIQEENWQLLLFQVGLPTAEMNCDLAEYVDMICGKQGRSLSYPQIIWLSLARKPTTKGNVQLWETLRFLRLVQRILTVSFLLFIFMGLGSVCSAQQADDNEQSTF